MKCFAAIVLLVLFAIAFTEAKPKPTETENIEPEAEMAPPNMPKNKRAVVLTYSSPFTYYGTPYFTGPYAYNFYDSYTL